ncbi:MAG TPA: hypothetical protein VN648_00055, partial [Candidatus Methylomirabilis sp.]|nr:hypothetical protein [Candidatus Methylomirabilis sp.]
RSSVGVLLNNTSFDDTTPPVTTASLSGRTGDHGWYRGPVIVTLSATDPDDAVAATYYSVDGGSNQTYSAPFSLGGPRVRQLSFYSVDSYGNQEKAHSLTIKTDAKPPVITLAARPATLWPPNGKMVSVSISGTITDATSGVNPSGAAFKVTDEYGSIQPSGSVTLGAGGNYTFAVSLQASRREDDRDGRLYTVTVAALDNAGNPAWTSMAVIVPHDRGGLGKPALSASIAGKWKSGTTITATLRLTDRGTGAASQVLIDQVDLRTLSGTDTVTLSSPPLPLSAGNLAIGASTNVTLTLNVPTTVTKFSLTEKGTVQDVAGSTFSFALAQTVYP